jgi:hypothetical protein
VGTKQVLLDELVEGCQNRLSKKDVKVIQFFVYFLIVIVVRKLVEEALSLVISNSHKLTARAKVKRPNVA